MQDDVAGRHMDHHRTVPLVLLLVHQQQHLVVRQLLVKGHIGRGDEEPVLPAPLALPGVGHADTEEVGVALAGNHHAVLGVHHHRRLAVIAQECLVVFLVCLLQDNAARVASEKVIPKSGLLGRQFMKRVSAVVEVHDPERGEDKLDVVKAQVQANILPMRE